MDHRIHQLQNHPLYQQGLKSKPTQNKSSKTFQNHLQDAQVQSSLKISKHAQKRLEERNIHINDSQWTEIQNQMDRAKTKGVTDSLVVLDDATLVVNTKNNTVITAMDSQETNNHVFTNINGTILLQDS
ncbi:flagellar operon protein [Salinibacillus kushneri]|uniref:Flagellar operon protein n=1 Tax=Salinibacillus kushneri TaxID=237682 RepID=A0A1I0EBB0_9BACI|nr:TIGR02530 family flagellar biosynthesis protein [Salinibacillus kushneri]SET41678.1 flagellar operon protein [Salinibacillus kushneri]